MLFQQLLASPANYLPEAKVELLSREHAGRLRRQRWPRRRTHLRSAHLRFRSGALQCPGGDGPGCLTAGQVGIVRAIYTGLKDPAGKDSRRRSPRATRAAPAAGAAGSPATNRRRPADGTLAFGAKAPSGYTLMDANFRFLALDDDAPGFSWRTFRFPADLPRLQTMTEILSPLDPDLRPFARPAAS